LCSLVPLVKCMPSDLWKVTQTPHSRDAPESLVWSFTSDSKYASLS
jgi:hypothetical protein